MFSLPKLLVLVAIILAVLYGFKMVTSINRRREAGEQPARPRATRQKRDQVEAEDLIPCPRCGAYISNNGEHDCRG
jgi:Ca2+/H+ antiporter